MGRTMMWGSPHGVVANVPDCDIVVSEFELRLRHYFHLRTNSFGKGMISYTTLLSIK